MMIYAAFLIGLLLGGILAWMLFARKEIEGRIRAEAEKKSLEERLEEEKKLLGQAKETLTDTFKALASTTLENSSKTFLTLAP